MKKQTMHGERIEEIRKDNKLSQRELAAQAGISYDALRRVENGETNTINSDMLIRLAEYFGVSTDYLLGLSNIRERRSYAVSELGLSEEAVKRLASRKIDPDSLNLFLANDRFAAITQLAKTYLLQRTLNGMLGMNMIMDYAIEGMKSASVTDPEAKRERVRHITALQGMKSQGNNAGRDQMERLFSQMLTEMEKEMAVRTNMQPTANDEMVLGMLKGMQSLEPDQRTLENAVALTAAIAGAQLQASEDTQGKLNDVMMSLMADFLKNTTEDGE